MTLAGASASGIRAGRAYVELGADMSRLDAGLRRAQAKVRAFGEGIKAIGMSMAKVGVGIGAPLALGAMAFANFEQAMARVKALTNATDGEFAALNTEAKRLGLDTVFSARQAAETMGVFALAGLNAREIIAALSPVLDTAAAGQMDLAQAADIALKTMKSMGYQASDTRMILDTLGKAMVTANTDLVMLGDAFKFVGPIARAAGLSLQETTATIQLLSDAGIQAEMAGTTLRGAILSLTTPSVEAKAKLAELGVEVSDQAGNFRGMAKIIADLERSMSGMGTGKKLEVLGTIFPARSAAGMATLLSEGSAKLAEYTKRLGDVGGTTAKIAATQLDTLKGTFTLLTSSVEGLGIAIGGALTPILRGLGEGLTLVLNLTSRWADENALAFRTLSVVSLSAITLGGSLMALGATIKLSALAISGLLIPLGLLKGSIAMTIGLATALKVSLAALASPAILIGGAVAGIGVAIAATSFQSGNALNNLKTNFLSLASTAAESFAAIREAIAMGDLGLAMEIAGAGMGVAWQKILGSLREGWDWALNWFDRSWATILSTFDSISTGIRNIWDGMLTMMLKGWHTMLGFVAAAWEKNKFWKSDAKIQARVSEIEAETEARITDLTEGRNERAAGRNAESEKFKSIYGANAEAIIAARTAATANTNAQGLAAAQSRLDSLKGKVDAKKFLSESGQGFQSLGAYLLDRYTGSGKPLPPSMEQLATSLGKGETQGTFSGGIAGLLGGKSVTEALLQQQVDSLKNIDRNTREGGRFS